jgi:DNA-binding helix-hairpin-helix protein with protein kinase domain
LTWYVDSPGLARRAIILDASFKDGAAGSIHRAIGERGVVAKIYKPGNDVVEYSKKIAAMLAARPNIPAVIINGRTYVQLAWPTGAISDDSGHFRGFLMPEVDTQAAVDLENVLQKSARRIHRFPENYGIRVYVAANLAAMFRELHALGHYMIDLKPQNVSLYRDNGGSSRCPRLVKM